MLMLVSGFFLITIRQFIVLGMNIPRISDNSIPQENYCQFLTFGGETDLHEYICCNNCHAGGSAESCDGHTYETGSNISYCGPCGIDKGGGHVHEEFPCNGCEGQATAETICLSKWPHFAGTCWIFASCMKNRCKDMTRWWWCGDGICNLAQGETTFNCPIDCCQTVTPDCIPQKGLCLPKCCNDPCCDCSSTPCAGVTCPLGFCTVCCPPKTRCDSTGCGFGG